MQRFQNFMLKVVFVICFILQVSVGFSQINPRKKGLLSNTESKMPNTADSTSNSISSRKPKENLLNKSTKGKDNEKKAKIQDYLIISKDNDTTFVDTTLTIQKEYKFNYLRKDNFGLMPFANLGQTYNSLTYNFQSTNLLPLFGARARHFNYMEIDDIYYYRVPTPLTELFYKTAFEQGQLADSFFTINTSPGFNFSIAYKGMRSLGQYQSILTSTGNFRVTTNYTTKNKRYQMRGHIVMQDLLNEENGGLQDDELERFETGDPDFLNRAIFSPNFENAESILKGKRFHLDHGYNIVNKYVVKDTAKVSETYNDPAKSQYKLSLKHTISFEDKSYQYDQAGASPLFGTAFNDRSFRDRVTLSKLYNNIELTYLNNELGSISVNISNTNYNYGYNKIVVLNNATISNRIAGDVTACSGKYKKNYKGFGIGAEGGLNLLGNYAGNYLLGEVSYNISEDVYAKAIISHNSKAPNFNAQLYQSNYQAYNWQNNFNNIKTQQLAFQIQYKNLFGINVDYSTITDYVYFKSDASSAATQSINAFQNNSIITYLRAKLENELKVGKFALNNTILYQNVQNSAETLNVPTLTTRNTLYYSSHVFKKALYLQTGITLNYFTKYFMNAYNPVLAEFYVQNDNEYGAFPRLDFFLNAKVRQTRIYLKAEHFNAAFTGYNYYSAPSYPYRDFTVRFGLVWNFFL